MVWPRLNVYTVGRGNRTGVSIQPRQPTSFIVVVVVVVAMFGVCLNAVVVTATHTLDLNATVTPSPNTDTSTATSTTTTWTVPAFTGCGGVQRCLEDHQCARCLSAINLSTGFSHSAGAFDSLDSAAVRTYNVGFLHTLLSTASCEINTTPPVIIWPALQELFFLDVCDEAYGMQISQCLLTEYACFRSAHCRMCLTALYAANSNVTKTDALRSPACSAANPMLLGKLFEDCSESFPQCTYAKYQCASLAECAPCLDSLMAGNGAAASRQCPPSTPWIGHIVANCFDSTSVACEFLRQRCVDDVICGPCLAAMGNGDSLSATAADWSFTPACQRVIEDNNDDDATMNYAMNYIYLISTGCPSMSTCRVAVTKCVLDYGYDCLKCMNGSATPDIADFCSAWSHTFSFHTECLLCPSSVHTINAVVFATATVGVASTMVCIAVATTILAHRRDLVSMRDRIVIGLMMANAVYSAANTIPLNALGTGVFDCGRLAMSFDAIRFGRAWWFCGKYGLVGFELFILTASIRAMRRGMSVMPWQAEAVMHVACCFLAMLAFAVFYVLCARINADGYNTSFESETYTNAYNHASINDDLDDDEPSTAASLVFKSERVRYNNLVQNMLVAWDVFAGLSVVLWIVLRALHQQILRALRTEAAAAAQAEAADVWVATRRSAWEARRRLLEARRETFSEVAKPLEPYIAVFVLFAAPALVMSTSYCQNHSGATAGGNAAMENEEDVGVTNLEFGACDVWCEFALAFRSLATVAVYLVPRERRVELIAVGSTFRKLCARVVGCVRCSPEPYARLNHDHNSEYEMDELEQQPVSNIVGNDDTSSAPPLTSWLISELNVVMEQRLGQGAFGEVWSGRLLPENRRVAIKIMFAGEVDADGDLVDPNADEDFLKECVALQRIDNAHLIKFFGYGNTKGGNGFIVTELMDGGSLEDMLHKSELDLPWGTRAKYGLHIALGMKHLHEKDMLHRDLKSANVLLDARHTEAKVCDFGLARVVRPARQHVVYSPFTGVTRLLPHAPNVDINNGSSIAVSIVDAHGTMTKAAGTLQWMAPEVFRGDQDYTRAVDVYSFGMVLWELATRKTPWQDDIEDSEVETSFFNGINHALQTGRRPTVPDDLSVQHGAFVAVIHQCWAGDPVKRPSFTDVVCELAAFMRSFEVYM